MSAGTDWPTWAHDLLAAADLPTTRLNQSFLTAWGKSQPTNCRRNPLVISHHEPGSTACRKLPGGSNVAQNYLSITSATDAFAAQIKAYEWLTKALESGDPYSMTGDAATAVAQNLSAWGSPGFAHSYTTATTTTGGILNAPQALKGWGDLRKSINRGMPKTLAHAQHVNKATLRSLRRSRKVKL